jgi:transposase
MTIKNKYSNRSKISEKKIRDIVRLFALDLGALQIAILLTVISKQFENELLIIVNNNPHFLVRLKLINVTSELVELQDNEAADHMEKLSFLASSNKTGSVYTEIVPNCARRTLQAVICGHVDLKTVIHSDGWRGYNGLVDVGYKKHFRVHHGYNEFATSTSLINGIESFWAYAKTRISKFRGLSRHTFYFHLKECEFRFNNRGDDLYNLIVKIIRNKPLF